MEKIVKINITTKDLTAEENRKVNEAVQIAERVLNSDEFRIWCINHSYEKVTVTGKLWWKRTYKQKVYGFHDTNMTGKQVYDEIMAGKEVLDPVEDQEADIFLAVDRNKRVIGYTYPNTKWQWVYSWVLDSWGPKDIAGNLIHEWCHKLGYSHEYNYTQNRQHSVPYAVGYYVASKG